MQHTECTDFVKFTPTRFQLRSVELAATVSDGEREELTLVLLHGVTRSWRDYVGVLPELAQLGRVIALDHRGHGDSSHRGPYRVREYGGDVFEFVRLHTRGPVVLIGHSLGALAAMLAAVLHKQDRLRAMVIEDPPGSLLEQSLLESRYHLQFTGLQKLLTKKWDPGDLAAAMAEMPVQHPSDGRVVPWREIRDAAALHFAAECLVSMDPQVIDDLVTQRWMETLHWSNILKALPCPVLLLHADPVYGGMLSEEDLASFRSHVPHLEYRAFPGCPHNIHAAQPDLYVREVTSFIRQHCFDTESSTDSLVKI